MINKLIPCWSSGLVVMGGDQCDQIGRILKVLGTKFAYKSSPKKNGSFMDCFIKD